MEMIISIKLTLQYSFQLIWQDHVLYNYMMPYLMLLSLCLIILSQRFLTF